MAKQIRMGVIGILAMAGLVLLAGEPIEEETWFEVFIATKIAGFALWGGGGSTPLQVLEQTGLIARGGLRG